MTRWVSTASASIGLVALGVALRLLQYGIPRSLWFDEARNTAEILKDSWQLMLPPHSAQPTPFGFLLLERISVAILGEGEQALRLLPLVAGIAALVVAARLAHRTLPGWAAPFAVAMLAVSGPAIYFSTEVKQYSCDLLAGLLIAFWFERHEAASNLADSPSSPDLPNSQDSSASFSRRIALFGLCGAIVLWISYTSIFFLAVAGTMLISRALRARDARGIALYGAMGGTWLASFALHYHISIAHWSQTRWLNAFWAAGFPGETEGMPAALSWSVSSLIAAFENPLGVTLGGGAVAVLAALLFGLGIAGAVRNRRPVHDHVLDDPALDGRVLGGRVLSLFAGVFFLVFLSALLQVYPFKGRLLLFLVPPMAFLVAHGLTWPLRFTASRAARGMAIAIAASLLAGGATGAFHLVRLEPLHRHGTVNLTRFEGVEKGFEGVSEVVRYVARNHQLGDAIYLYYSAEPGFAYYARQLEFGAETTVGVRSQRDYAGYAADLEALRGNARVWVVFSHTVEEEKTFIVQHLETIGKRLDFYRRPRADAYLFDLRERPPARASRSTGSTRPTGSTPKR